MAFVEILGYLASFIMGGVLGAIGGGGSILTVPILVYLFGLDPKVATSYSLFVVGCTAAIGMMTYIKQKQVDFKTGGLFMLPSFLGVWVSRHYLAPLAGPTLVMITFATVMVLASYFMIAGQKFSPHQNKNLFYISLVGLGVGLLTGFVGAGGGFLIIPGLVLLTGLSMKIAVGTSLMIIATNTLFGFINFALKASDINWKFLIGLSLLAIAGIFAGSHFANKIPEQKLKKGFGYFVLIMGSAILLAQLK